MFSARSPQPLTPSKAWAFAAINQLAFPGLGTIMARRKIGYVQAALMLAGFFLSMAFMFRYFKSLIDLMMHADLTDEQAKAVYRSYAWAGITGLSLCAIAWTWALVSSFAILRAASLRPPDSDR